MLSLFNFALRLHSIGFDSIGILCKAQTMTFNSIYFVIRWFDLNGFEDVRLSHPMWFSICKLIYLLSKQGISFIFQFRSMHDVDDVVGFGWNAYISVLILQYPYRFVVFFLITAYFFPTDHAKRIYFFLDLHWFE